ncbi:TonB-dependent hemoglobin/transferrin/lactoferrin family receptor [Roseomonas eburnea]|uniref:TonB-dependent hemoglobin/transferrin/lactoferrin family receptor n=1 Tax=Neoroseomonas eburnea TaxID=1346889 RepID=A0A9X9XDV4_9PROT|nr:TonB-dependent hemoglobin/transferrin/lactoferrin family receptor [Neoroseomonas eburnea]MBR0681890.1 TonB-dependent hemoglobin/transferrin/lactoferrin family receptor [Neoroseomonas eburnea]
MDSRQLLVTTIALLAAAPAAAQTPGAAEAVPPAPAATPSPTATSNAPAATPLDAVTATGTRTPGVSGDGAAPVSVIRREEILERDSRSVSELIRDVPGVEISGVPRTTAMQPMIRGLGDDRIVFRIDGARNNFNAGHRGRIFVDPELLRQVDVLRGPGSTLYGSGAIGGVISMRTIEPDDLIRPGSELPVGGFLRGGYQSQGGMWRGTAAAAARAGDFAALGAISGFNNAYVTDGAGNTIPYTGDQVANGLARLQWRPGFHAFDLAAQMFRDSHVIPIAANTATTTSVTDRVTEQQVYTLRWNYNDPGMPLLQPQVVAYRNHVQLDERRQTGTRARDTTELTTTGIDAQNTSRFQLFGWDRHTLTLGTEIYRDEQEGTQNDRPRGQFPSANQDVMAFFVQDQIAIGDLTLVAALRYDSFDQSADGNTNDRSVDRFSPRVSAAYQVLPWLEPYVAYAEAFRAPSLTELYVSGQHFPGNSFVPNPNLQPETSHNIEAGVNLRFSDVLRDGDRLRIRVTAFRNEIDNFIEQLVFARTTESRNVRTARIEGIEAELQYDAGSWFGAVSASALKGDNLTDDQPLASVPANRMTLSGGYRFLDDGVTVGARWLLVAAQDRNPTNIPGLAEETSGYGLLDLYASWRPNFAPNLRFDIGVDNVFDHAYRRSTWNSNPPPPFYEVGRNIRGAVTLTF